MYSSEPICQVRSRRIFGGEAASLAAAGGFGSSKDHPRRRKLAGGEAGGGADIGAVQVLINGAPPLRHEIRFTSCVLVLIRKAYVLCSRPCTSLILVLVAKKRDTIFVRTTHAYWESGMYPC